MAIEKARSSSALMTARQAEKPDVEVKDRMKYLRTRLKRSGCPFSLSNGRFGGMRGYAFLDNTFVGVGGQFYEGGDVVYRFNVMLQTETWRECEPVLVAAGDALEAYSSHILPRENNEILGLFRRIQSEVAPTAADTARAALTHDPAAVAFERQQRISAPWLEKAELEREEAHAQAVTKLDPALIALAMKIPRLIEAAGVVRESPFQPKELGWINYWSSQTCEFLGFPDPVRDRDLLANSYQTPAGAWVIKLCAEELDLNRLDHLKIFVDTYARFPKIGIRLPENPPAAPPPLNYPQNTIFVRGNWQHIAEQIVCFFQEQDFKCVERIPELATDAAVEICVFPGAKTWTIIKSIPPEYFGEAVSQADEPRMASLCRRLQCDGFMLSVYNPIEAILLEVSSQGRTHISGFYDLQDESAAANAVQTMASANPSVVNFDLLAIDLEIDMLNLDNCGQLAQQINGELAGANVDLCENENLVNVINGELRQGRQLITLRFMPSEA